MRFGRRLALFFLLIAIVPTAALITILLFVSGDSQQGKADARLAAGLQTAAAVYSTRTGDATRVARRLARDPDLAAAMRAGDPSQLRAFTEQAAVGPGVVRIELLDNAGHLTAAAGLTDAAAFAEIGLTEQARPVGTIRVSTTTAEQYVTTVRGLTGREVVLSRGSTPLASTLAPPPRMLQPNETADLTVGGTNYRAHAVSLSSSDGETLLLLGPPKSGGIGLPVLAILVWFLAAAVVLAWALARTLTRLHQRVAAEAVTDSLTGLRNRRYLSEALEREVARSLRFGHPISLMILDVDDFKKINDYYGHVQGDLVLEGVADVVREATRLIDVAARYGGDEFAVILVETGREGAAIVGERLGYGIREARVPLRERGSMGVTLSVGVATIPDSAQDLDSLVDAADRALFRAKRAGKNQIRTAPPDRRGAAPDDDPRRADRRGRSREWRAEGKQP